MPYRLQKNEPLAAGLKRVAEEQLTGAIGSLQSSQDLDQGIYQARKFLKKARSLMRLLAPQLGPIYVQENRRLRDVARQFSAARDMQVSLQLLDQFAQQYKRRSTLSPVRQTLTSKNNALHQQAEWQRIVNDSVQELTATSKRIEDWPLRNLAESLLEAQIRKTHKQSRHAFLKASQTRTAEDFHELRKLAKRELNQLRLLQGPDAPLNELKQIADLLGDHHNLAVFLLNIESCSKRFEVKVRRQMQQLEIEAVAAAARLYSDTVSPA